MANIKSIHLNGSTQYCNRAGGTKGSDYTAYTVEAWIKADSLPTSGNYGMIWMEYSADMKIYFGLWNDGGTQKIKVGGEFSVGGWVNATYEVTLTTGTWYHIRATWEGSGSPMRLYLDESDVGNSANTNGVPVNETDGMIAGAWAGGGSHFLDGLIDELRIWSIDRGSTFTDKCLELVGDEAGLQAYYKFEDNATDSEEGGNYDLTENNSPTYDSDVAACFEATTTSTTTTTTTTTTSSSTTSTVTTTSSSTTTSTTTTSSSTTTTVTTTSSSTTSSTTTTVTTTSSSTTTTVTTTSSSTTTTTTIDPASGGLAFGEQNPVGETAVSWQTFSDGAGSIPDTEDGIHWGKIVLEITEQGRSQVYDFGNGNSRVITVTADKYGAGSGNGTLYIRGRDVIFTQDDVGPAWEEYTAPVSKTWQYIQVRAIKE